jgi:shikimate kinase
VIATGGSVIYRDYAMKKLQTMGKIVYLQYPYEVIARRLGDLKKRGVALKEGFTLKDLYEERTPLYEKYANIIVKMPDGTKMDAVNAVLKALNA